MVDFLHAIAGPESPLETMQVLARPGGDADANFGAQFRFAGGLTAQLLYTTLGHPAVPKERVEAFLGDEVVIVNDFRSVEIHRSGLRIPGGKTKVDKGFQDEWKAFHRACSRGPALPIPLEQLRSVSEATFRLREGCRA
jgi:hypothetical protein